MKFYIDFYMIQVVKPYVKWYFIIYLRGLNIIHDRRQ